MCLIATIVEMANYSRQPNKAENVENGGHISLDTDANEKTLLLPDVATETIKKDDGKIMGYKSFCRYESKEEFLLMPLFYILSYFNPRGIESYQICIAW